LRITDVSKAANRVDVGLVCTEYYDHRVRSDGGTARATGEAVAFECWERASGAAPHQSFAFGIPEEAPFSYEASAVAYAWKASARIPEAMRSDPARHRPALGAAVSLELRLERVEYRPGETVRGWTRTVLPRRARSLEAFLVYREKTRDYEDAAYVVRSGPLHHGDLSPDRWLEFALTLPADALPAHRSAHGELYWETDVKVDEFGPDTHARQRLDLVAVRPPETSGVVPAGWHVDPSGQHRSRWWDGSA